MINNIGSFNRFNTCWCWDPFPINALRLHLVLLCRLLLVLDSDSIIVLHWIGVLWTSWEALVCIIHWTARIHKISCVNRTTRIHRLIEVILRRANRRTYTRTHMRANAFFILVLRLMIALRLMITGCSLRTLVCFLIRRVKHSSFSFYCLAAKVVCLSILNIQDLNGSLNRFAS